MHGNNVDSLISCFGTRVRRNGCLIKGVRPGCQTLIVSSQIYRFRLDATKLEGLTSCTKMISI
jgi:hypothetical protein